MVYQGSTPTGAIGTLLRLLEEEKTNSPVAAPSASAGASPIRQATQLPYFTPESPGSARIVSERPESATGQGPQSEALPTVQAPARPPAPVPAPRVSAPGQPSAPFPTPVPTPAPTPAVGIKATPKVTSAVLGIGTKILPQARQQVQPSRLGQPSVNPRRAPTPTPAPFELKNLKQGVGPKKNGGFYYLDPTWTGSGYA